MDVLNVRSGRNGLNGEFFEFAPLAPFLAALLGAVAIAKSRATRKTKYAEAQTQALAEKYPFQENSIDQGLILEQMLKESAATLEQRNKSKGRKRAELTGRLRAFDTYIKDYQAELQRLKQEELSAPVPTASTITQPTTTPPTNQTATTTTPTKTAPEDGVLGTASVDNKGTTKEALTPDTTELQGMVQGATAQVKSKPTLLYVGLGVVALLLIIKLAKK